MQQPRRVSLYRHKERQHTPRNSNVVHQQEQQEASLNARIAVVLTKSVGTMPTAYTFALLAIVGLCAILGLLPPPIVLLVAWLSQTFIQLVLLPIIMVGQNVLGRKQELQSDEMFHTTEQSFADIEGIMRHLDAQDLVIMQMLTRLNNYVEGDATVLLQKIQELTETQMLMQLGFQQFSADVFVRLDKR